MSFTTLSKAEILYSRLNFTVLIWITSSRDFGSSPYMMLFTTHATVDAGEKEKIIVANG